MSLLEIFFGKRKNSAAVAKERLQIILAHERSSVNNGGENTPSWLPDLQRELLAVVAKYVKVDQEALKVNLEKRDNLELLEINITLPEKEEQE